MGRQRATRGNCPGRGTLRSAAHILNVERLVQERSLSTNVAESFALAWARDRTYTEVSWDMGGR